MNKTNQTIYLKEHPTESEVCDKQPEIYNDNNPALFTVREMREVANDLACKVLFRNDGTATGFWDVCKSLPIVNKKLLSFTETVEQASICYENTFDEPNGTESADFLSGAAWQKEKDRALIEELFTALKTIYESCNPKDVTENKMAMGVDLGKFYVGSVTFPSDKSIHVAKKAITKAEQHLNNQ